MRGNRLHGIREVKVRFWPVRLIPTAFLARHPIPGAQRRARIEGSSPAKRTLPSVRDLDLTNPDVPTLDNPALGAQRRTRIEVSSPAVRILPWKLAGNEDVAVGFEL